MYRVIIADDEALIRAGLYYRNDWSAMGFEVIAMLEDGEDILKYLEEQRADVLLTDICMYQVSGLQVANIIKEKYPWMKVVLLSGYKEFEYAREAMHCGVYEYLLKPIDYDKLRVVFGKIKEELDRAKQEEQLLHSFGEEEYDQVLSMTRVMTEAVLGEEEETWVAYAHLKPLMRNAPKEIRQVVIKRLIELLQTKLYQKDGELAGAVIINIDVERLGDYIGSGKYRNKDYSSTLLIYDEAMENLIYSDEYRLLNEEEHFELEIGSDWENCFSKVLTVEGRNYIVSGLKSEQNAFRYLYLTSMHQFELQNQATNQLLRNILIMIVGVCLILASLLAIWVYKPIQHTMRVLNDVSMLTEWDKKEQVNEIERIQRSILSAKKEKDNLNEQIQERIISLHNAQICALQTQINPHFLYNTLEAIGNATALLMNGDNKVTDMIYSLGLLMRISLSGENYLVPLKEELKHVELYVKLVDFHFRGRIRMHMEIPKELENEKIVKLTLQPLIENAIQHGLAHKRSQADIWIKGEKDGDKNYIYVIDNGKGVSEDKLFKLQTQLEEAVIGSGQHIGLRNVNQRLKLAFGEEYGLAIKRAEEGGMCVSICYKTV